MLNKTLKIYKNIGETPLEALKKFQKNNPEYIGQKMTYAGRLDPMAEGELLVLVGEECKKKDEYLEMNKQYEFEVIFGFKTDTYDLLGLSEHYDIDKEGIKNNLEKNLQSFIGKRSQKYPPFSSKPVDGVALFERARSGQIDKLPERIVEIYDLKLIGFRDISKDDFWKYLKDNISLVTGDFRQKEILDKWQDNLSKTREGESFLVCKIVMDCSSGTYVRSLVNDLPYSATTFSIKRIKIYK